MAVHERRILRMMRRIPRRNRLGVIEQASPESESDLFSGHGADGAKASRWRCKSPGKSILHRADWLARPAIAAEIRLAVGDARFQQQGIQHGPNRPAVRLGDSGILAVAAPDLQAHRASTLTRLQAPH